MKDIVDLKVAQIRLYPIDTLPLSALAIEKNLIAFKEKFRFKESVPHGIIGGGLAFLFQAGEIEFQGKNYLVEQLAIESQKMGVSILGDSAVAEAFYEAVAAVLAHADPRGVFAKTNPYIKTEETTCVVTLNVDFEKLFATPFLKFLRESVQKQTSFDAAKSEVTPFRFTARISYEPLNPIFKKIGLSIADKEFLIEPRIRTLPEEHRYFTKSPTDSETHLKLLREFEKLFSGKR